MTTDRPRERMASHRVPAACELIDALDHRGWATVRLPCGQRVNVAASRLHGEPARPCFSCSVSLSSRSSLLSQAAGFAGSHGGAALPGAARPASNLERDRAPARCGRQGVQRLAEALEAEGLVKSDLTHAPADRGSWSSERGAAESQRRRRGGPRLNASARDSPLGVARGLALLHPLAERLDVRGAELRGATRPYALSPPEARPARPSRRLGPPTGAPAARRSGHPTALGRPQPPPRAG